MGLGKGGKEGAPLGSTAVLLIPTATSAAAVAGQLRGEKPELEVLGKALHGQSCRHREGRPHPRFPAHCFLRRLPRSFTRRRKKKKIPSAECESQTHRTTAGPAPGPPAWSPVCWEAARFRETGSPEITEAGSTWLAGGSGAGSTQRPTTSSAQPRFAPRHRLVVSPLPFASPAAAASLPALPQQTPVRSTGCSGTRPCRALGHPGSGPPWIWHPHLESAPRERSR